jgi:sugar (pentulose or hexulose) kinase
MLLGLDLGTGSAKALLIAAAGTVRDEGAASCPVRSSRTGLLAGVDVHDPSFGYSRWDSS